MPRHRRFLLLIATTALVAATAAIATAAGAQSPNPSMTVTPQSGVRPLSVVVKGTACATTKPTVDAAPQHQIRVQWQVAGAPWTSQTRIIADGQNAAPWSTTLLLGVPNIGTNIVKATCLTSGGQTVLSYPEQKVEVLAAAPALAASPTSIIVGGSFAASADRCPDPDGPRLGGGYFVDFRLEYLIPPNGTQGPYSESTTVWTNVNGTASTSFVLPTNAPTEGGSYRLSASCNIEELGSSSVLFNYSPVAISVAAQPDPTPTVSPTPTPTSTPQPTPTPTTGPTPAPTSTPSPTTTPQPTTIPLPTATPIPGGGNVISFTG